MATTNNFVFRELIPSGALKEGNLELPAALQAALDAGPIVFYPSSGYDIYDLRYMDNKRIPELGDENPRVFIHSDYMCNTDFFSSRDGIFSSRLKYPDFHSVNFFRWYVQDDHDPGPSGNRSIVIYSFKREEKSSQQWLLFFRGYFNEQVLDVMIKKKIRIPMVYAVCDGITRGMGGGHPESIPTVFYPLLPSALGIQHIITEQSWKNFRERILQPGQMQSESNECRRWLENIYRITKQDNIRMLLEKDNEILRNQVLELLDQVPEVPVNSIEKLRFFSGCFTDSLVIKNINRMTR